MHAACTASERLAAFGSHQNMWQQKEAGPAAMMNAKVWTSLPTARKERKRTRHSPSTASVWREGTQLVRSGLCVPLARPSHWQLALSPQPPSKQSTPTPGLYLLMQDGEGGRGHADVTWGPLLAATGGQD